MILTPSILEAAGFTTTQTPNKCTCHERGDFRIYIPQEGCIFGDRTPLMKKLYRKSDYTEIVKNLKDFDHLKSLWPLLTGEELMAQTADVY